MDTGLIALAAKVKKAFADIGLDNPIILPQIIILGSHGCGKSSVLERIVGKNFMPKEYNATRPLVYNFC